MRPFDWSIAGVLFATVVLSIAWTCVIEKWGKR